MIIKERIEFLFQIGTIKTLNSEFGIQRHFTVSIPNWYD